MKFKDVAVHREARYALGTEEQTGKHYISIPVSSGIVDYEEYYEIDQAAFEHYRSTSTTRTSSWSAAATTRKTPG